MGQKSSFRSVVVDSAHLVRVQGSRHLCFLLLRQTRAFWNVPRKDQRLLLHIVRFQGDGLFKHSLQRDEGQTRAFASVVLAVDEKRVLATFSQTTEGHLLG